MKLAYSNIIIFSLISFTFAGCYKLEAAHHLTGKEIILTAHGWHLSMVIENGVLHKLTAPWSQHDCSYFYPDGTYLSHSGQSSGKIVDRYGRWELNEEETELIFLIDDPSFGYSLPVEIKADTMRLTLVMKLDPMGTVILNTDTLHRIYIYTQCR